MKASKQKLTSTAENAQRELLQLKGEGEFSKAIALADFLIKERSRDRLIKIELLCLKSECQLRMALFAEALSSALNALHEARELNTQEWVGRALFRIGAVYAGLEMFDLSIKHVEEAVEIHRRCENKSFYVSSLVGLSAIRIHLQEFEQARHEATRAARMAYQLNALDELIKAKVYIAECCLNLGEFATALKHSREAERYAIRLDDHFLLAKSAYILGKCCIRTKNYGEAERYFLLSIDRFKELRDKGSLKSSLEWLARTQEARGLFKEATASYKSVIALERELLVEHRQSIRIQLNENGDTFTSRLLQRSSELTATEIKVCELLLKFFSNKEIAKFLGISVLTVERHRFNIRKKLGLRTGSSLTVALLNT